MSKERITVLLEWGLRLMVVVLLILWIVTPPQATIRKNGMTVTLNEGSR
jgi:hypothetical protein